MKKVWKIISAVLLWIATAFLSIMVLGTLNHWSCILALLLIVLIIPISPWQRLIKKVLPTFVKIILGVVLFIAFVIALPATEKQQTDGSGGGGTQTTTVAALTTTTTETAKVTTATGSTAGTTTATTEVSATTSLKSTERTTRETTTKKATTKATTAKPKTTAKATVKATTTKQQEKKYVLNTDTRKFHTPSCRHVKQIKEENKATYSGSRNDLISQGYAPCGTCHP